jgi:hypothetical protein
MTPLFLRAQWGLGDSIFVRPFVREAARLYDVYLETPWPELFDDLPVKFVRLERKLRTQMKNVRRQPDTRWVLPPEGLAPVSIGYNGEDLKHASIVQTLERKYRGLGVVLKDPVWDLPDTGPQPVNLNHRPIAVVRPVTQRREWKNAARNPRPEYVDWVSKRLMNTHHVIAVADLQNKEEWLEAGVPPHHMAALRGEFDLRSLIALVRNADVVVGGVGWIVPMSIALGTKAFVILGGHGAHNHPDRITDPRMDLSRLTFAKPERFCPCSNMNHQCDKYISNFPHLWETFVRSSDLGCSTSARRVG